MTLERTRKRLTGLASLLMLAGVLSYLTGPARFASAQGTIVRLEPSNPVIGVGSTVAVNIRIENVNDLYLADVILHFNPAALEVVDADPGKNGVQIQAGTFLRSDGRYEDNYADNVNGEIGFLQEVADDTVNGSGVLATITFRGKAAGVWDVTFDADSVLEDTQGPGPDYTIEGVTFQKGSITVSISPPAATQTATASPSPSATVTHTPTPGPSPTPTDTPTPGPSPTPMSGPSPTPTDTPTPGPSPTPTETPPPGAAPTSTPETPYAPSPAPTSSPPPLPTATTAGVLYYRVMQVWPDRSMGVASGELEGPTAQAAVLSFGVYSTSVGEIVRGRTYLHFPLDVFPLGSEILRATLYVYVDSGAGGGEATFGAYRALEPWNVGDWGNDPANWPTLLTSPIALTTARSDAAILEPLAPVPAPLATSTSTPAPTPSATSTAEPRSGTLTPTPPTSPLSQPPSPLDTPTPPPPTVTPPSPTQSPTASPVPSPMPSPVPGAAPVLSLQPMAGTWLAWDVTALARAWLTREVANDGLALAAAPNPDVGPEAAGNLLVARQLTADDPTTRPYLIVQIAVHPVTPTPVVLLPRAGSPAKTQWGGAILLAAGALLLVLGLLVRGNET